MRTPPDLHRADRDARRSLRDELVALRRDCGLTALDRLGPGRSHFALLERRISWAVPTLQAWSRVLYSRLRLEPHGLPPAALDAVSAILAIRPADPVLADAFEAAELVEQLHTARADLGVSQLCLAKILGCSGTAIGNLENRERPALLATLQRYTRGLGIAAGRDVWLEVGLDGAQ